VVAGTRGVLALRVPKDAGAQSLAAKFKARTGTPPNLWAAIGMGCAHPTSVVKIATSTVLPVAATRTQG
jgi:hypothetical protein